MLVPASLGLVPILSFFLTLGLFSLFFFSINALSPFFPRADASFFSTSVLPFRGNVLLPFRYVSAIGFVASDGYSLFGRKALFPRRD